MTGQTITHLTNVLHNKALQTDKVPATRAFGR